MFSTEVKGVAIMGATATGKSRAAIAVAQAAGGEIISMDSQQVYRGMDIGTAKPDVSEQGGIRHHLIDLLNPRETNSAGKHVARAAAIAQDIGSRGRIAFFVGGTGLYFRALFGGLIDVDISEQALAMLRKQFERRSVSDLYAELERVDPKRACALSPKDRIRITRSLEIYRHTGTPHSEHLARPHRACVWRGLSFVLTMPRAALRRRIQQRTEAMFRSGWVDEVRKLLDDGVEATAPGFRGLGYRRIAAALGSGEDPALTLNAVVMETQQYAKRQETFFRSVTDAKWIDVSVLDAAEEIRRTIERAPDFKSNLT